MEGGDKIAFLCELTVVEEVEVEDGCYVGVGGALAQRNQEQI